MSIEDVNHHKYKRCMGLAKVCECRTAYTCGLRLRHNLMWRERWLKLAEYFKENGKDLDEIKRGPRAEIKEWKNEQIDEEENEA